MITPLHTTYPSAYGAIPAFGRSNLPAPNRFQPEDRLEIRFGEAKQADAARDNEPFASDADRINWLSRVFLVNTAGQRPFIVESRLEDAVTRAYVKARARALDIPDFDGLEEDPYDTPWPEMAQRLGLDPEKETEDAVWDTLHARTMEEMRKSLFLLDDDDRRLFDAYVVPLLGGEAPV